MEEQQMALVRRAITQIWNGQELDVADEVFAADYVNHNGLIIDRVRGPDAIKVSVALYRLAFPHLHITVQELHADDDQVWLRWTAASPSTAPPHEGVLCEPPVRSERSFAGSIRLRLAGGQIVESWTDWDQADGLARLGLIRSAEHAPATMPFTK
ncbi:MAG: ester cyclase [Herpetosiphonaceae bacterium]|nr:ester cyclase [Herpetosiphonaceae bacterium]